MQYPLTQLLQLQEHQQTQYLAKSHNNFVQFNRNILIDCYFNISSFALNQTINTIAHC